MSKREPKIVPCPFCGQEVRIDGKHLECIRCYYRVGLWCDTEEEFSAAIRAHNELCSRIPRAKLLQMLGGMRGWQERAFSTWKRLLPGVADSHACASEALAASMDKIRNMAKESSK